MENLSTVIIEECKRLGIKIPVHTEPVSVKIRGVEYVLAEPLAAFYQAFNKSTIFYFDKYKDGWPSTRLVRSIAEYSDQYSATNNHPYFAVLEDAFYSMYLLRADDITSDPMVYYLDHDEFSKDIADEYMTLSRFLAKLMTREEANELIKKDDYIEVNDIAIATAIGENSPQQVTELVVDSSEIEDITGLEEFTHLTRLSVSNNRIQDVSALQNLSNLIHLNLENNNITDISALCNLTKLEYLNLDRNNIADISPLTGMKKLKKLSIKHNKIKDADPVYTLENLEKLEIEEDILDFDKLNLMQNLQVLNKRGKNS
ncbi:MAG: leucine-rich repeat domain-containing protein [Spirochaetes bacterium]|nr:leucine-rich repeat domain-containing protein [Spirochaetota bacterium]MBN2769381.1 leucine-rich repeat domain-containing protein [Spirochaetota bacterium]